MDRTPEKSGSFSGESGDAQRPVDEKSEGQGRHSTETECHEKQDVQSPKPGQTPTSLSQAIESVDRFVEQVEEPPKNPCAIGSLPEMLNSTIAKLEMTEGMHRLGRHGDEDALFFSAVDRISKLLNKVRQFPPDASSDLSCLHRVSSVQHHAISFLEEEFRCLLDCPKPNGNHGITVSDQQNSKGTPKGHRRSSSGSAHHEPDRCVLSDLEPIQEEEKFPPFSPESIATMSRIAGVMISSGYEAECCMIYGISRRHAFHENLSKLGFDNINVEEVQRMPWESLEETITTWIYAFRRCSTVLFAGERKLCESVFSGHSSIANHVFSDLTSAVIIRLLDFSGAVVLTERAQEKLFKFLDMYETLRDVLKTLDDGESSGNLISEITLAQSRLGEAAVSIFCELEKSIKGDSSRTPVPGGAVHPLTRYTMNYLKLACEYKDTLEQVFRRHNERELEKEDGLNQPEPDHKQKDTEDDGTPRLSPFGVQLKTAMELLDANLDMKSKLYREPALRFVFLMNNGRYILQKIKGSEEIHEIMGASWTRKRSSQLRQYHKNYQRETWSRVLQCMSHEGLMVNGKVSKPVLKERFKSFNMTFDEIHKTQSTWVVSDEQLQSELRVSISAVVIPAYRFFLGRFKQHLDPGRQTEKYIKYQPEDIEILIDDLFDGNRASMTRRRT